MLDTRSLDSAGLKSSPIYAAGEVSCYGGKYYVINNVKF
jgi:predicted oxidoreductase